MRRPPALYQNLWVSLATIALAGVILILRRPDALLAPQFFAEDGVIFFLNAYENGPKAIVESYAGYLHVAPRLIAWFANHFDPLWIPAIYNYTAWAVAVLVVAAIFSPRIRLPAKSFLAISVALVPHTGEVLISFTNIQWWLALALVLLLLAEDARKPVEYFGDLFVLVLCGLSGPFLIFLFPLYVVRALVRRGFVSFSYAVLAGLTAAVQALSLYQHRAAFMQTAPPDVGRLLSGFAGRIFATFGAGYGLPSFPSNSLLIGGGVILAAGVFWLALRPGEWRLQRSYLALAAACFVIPVGVKFYHDAATIAAPENGDRYFFLPHVLLGWLLVVGCAQFRGRRRLLLAAVLGLSWIANIPYFRVPPLKDYHWSHHVQPIREGRDFVVPINPSGWQIFHRAKSRPRPPQRP